MKTNEISELDWILVPPNVRFGGAENVPTDSLAENEGFAVVCETKERDRRASREIQMYASTHVMANGGAIISLPITEPGIIYVGFVGRCQICPNAELISFQQLKTALPHYSFELWPEWHNWSIGSRSAA